MKRRTFTIHGKTSPTGALMIANQLQMNQFLKDWPDSSFTVELTLNESGTSEALIAYYKRYILPEFQHAFKETQGERMTIEEVDLKLREMSSVLKVIEVVEGVPGMEIECILPIEKAGNHKASEYISDLRLIGSSEFGIDIKDPKTV